MFERDMTKYKIVLLLLLLLLLLLFLYYFITIITMQSFPVLWSLDVNSANTEARVTVCYTTAVRIGLVLKSISLLGHSIMLNTQSIEATWVDLSCIKLISYHENLNFSLVSIMTWLVGAAWLHNRWKVNSG